MNEISLIDILSLPEYIDLPCFSISDSDILDEWLSVYFENPEHLCVVLWCESSNQFFIFIREHGLYSNIVKCELTVGFIEYNMWNNSLPVYRDGRFWESNDDNLLRNNLYFICSNDQIATQIILDLYQIINNRIINWLFYRVDQLVEIINDERENNTRAAEMVNIAFEQSITTDEGQKDD